MKRSREHDDEEYAASIPAAEPTDPPAINTIPDCGRSSKPKEFCLNVHAFGPDTCMALLAGTGQQVPVAQAQGLALSPSAFGKHMISVRVFWAVESQRSSPNTVRTSARQRYLQVRVRNCASELGAEMCIAPIRSRSFARKKAEGAHVAHTPQSRYMSTR